MVEGSTLEKCHIGNGIVGSNPTSPPYLLIVGARSSAGLEHILAEDEVVGSNPIGRTKMLMLICI